MTDPLKPEEAVESLYALYAHDIFRYARLTLGNDSDGYDAVQEVFYRAFVSWNAFRHEANAKTWLMKIAHNYVFDIYRKRRSERRHMAETEMPNIPDPSTSIEDILVIEEAVNQLKDSYRQVIVMRYVEHLSIVDTALVLGWSTAKVSTTSHRALSKLRHILSSTEGGGSDDAI